jgi:hypothetical protein
MVVADAQKMTQLPLVLGRRIANYGFYLSPVWSDSTIIYNVCNEGNLLTEVTLTRVYSKPCCG